MSSNEENTIENDNKMESRKVAYDSSLETLYNFIKEHDSYVPPDTNDLNELEKIIQKHQETKQDSVRPDA